MKEVEVLWNDEEAQQYVKKYEKNGEDIALRVYTSRLIGGDPNRIFIC